MPEAQHMFASFFSGGTRPYFGAGAPHHLLLLPANHACTDGLLFLLYVCTGGWLARQEVPSNARPCSDYRRTSLARAPPSAHSLPKVCEVVLSQRKSHSLEGGSEVAAVLPPLTVHDAEHQLQHARASLLQQAPNKS